MSHATAAGPVAILAVDGGNSKTDVALFARDGSVLGVARTHSAAGCAILSKRQPDLYDL